MALPKIKPIVFWVEQEEANSQIQRQESVNWKSDQLPHSFYAFQAAVNEQQDDQKANLFNDTPAEVETWDIESLQNFFNGIELPNEPLRLSPCEVIKNLPRFIDSHLNTIRTYNGQKTGKPYYDRLCKLKNLLSQ